MSRSNRFPDGLANSSGAVGRYLMSNGAGIAAGTFEHEVNGYRGMVDTRVIHDLYELDPSLGLIGGGGFDVRFHLRADRVRAPRPAVRWADLGPGLQADAARTTSPARSSCFGHTTQLPVPTNSISLDPAVTDDWGLPAVRVTFTEHPNDVKLFAYFRDRSMELAQAAGAVRIMARPLERHYPVVHLLGTCRMGERSQAHRRRRPVPPRARRSEPVPGGRQQLRHLRPGPAHHDDSGPGVSRRGARRRRWPAAASWARSRRPQRHRGGACGTASGFLPPLCWLAAGAGRQRVRSSTSRLRAEPSCRSPRRCGSGPLLMLSGQLGTDSTATLVSGGIQPETRQALENIRRILQANGSSLDHVVKCTVMLADMKEWGAMNEVYVTFFPSHLPARSAFGTSGLARNARVELECWATIP